MGTLPSETSDAATLQQTKNVNAKARIDIGGILVRIFIVVVMANGIIANFLPLKVNSGTLSIDIVVLILCIFAILQVHRRIKNGEHPFPKICVPFFIIYLLIIIFTLLSIKIVGYYPQGLITNLRIRFYYFLVAPVVFLILSPDDTEDLLEFFINVGACFCIFSIVQGVFGQYLDSRLLEVSYDGSLLVSSDDYTELRSNALMGNAIEFGGVCVMLFVCGFISLFQKGFSIFRLARLIVIVCGCYFSYSRIAFAAIIVFFIIIFLIMMKKSVRVMKYSKFILIGGLLIFALIFLLGDNTLLDRFLGTDELTSVSNEGHYNVIIASLNIIKDNLLFGIGLGTQTVSDQSVIRDGWWFQLTTETGLFVFILYIAFFAYLGYLIFRFRNTGDKWHESISIAALLILIYFCIASFINSSFIGRSDLNLFFVIVACWAADGMRVNKGLDDAKGNA